MADHANPLAGKPLGGKQTARQRTGGALSAAGKSLSQNAASRKPSSAPGRIRRRKPKGAARGAKGAGR